MVPSRNLKTKAFRAARMNALSCPSVPINNRKKMFSILALWQNTPSHVVSHCACQGEIAGAPFQSRPVGLIRFGAAWHKTPCCKLLPPWDCPPCNSVIGFVFYQENAGSSGKLKSITPRSSEILLFTLQKSRFSERSTTNRERERENCFKAT